MRRKIKIVDPSSLGYLINCELLLLQSSNLLVTFHYLNFAQPPLELGLKFCYFPTGQTV